MKTESRHRQKQNEIEKAWDSWEMILFHKLEGYDNLLEAIKADLSAAGMKKARGEEFLHEQITEMIEQIQENKRAKKVG